MIKLRSAQFSDYSAIAGLHAKSWQQNYRGIFSDQFLDKEVEQERSEFWHHRLKSPKENQQVTIAVLDENTVGFSCLLLNDDPVFGSLLDNLHVSVTLQKSGIGKLLMKECAKIICEKSNIKKMYLWVYESNKNAISVYTHLGGVNVETVDRLNEDGTKAKALRYIWADASRLI